MKSVPDTKFHVIRVAGQFHDVCILFMSLFFPTNEREKKKRKLLLLNGKPFEFCGGILFFVVASPSFHVLFSSVFFFAYTFKVTMSLKVATKKKSVTVIIELIYVVCLLLDSVEHDDAAICRLVFIHFSVLFLWYFSYFSFSTEIVGFVFCFSRKRFCFINE